MNAPIEVSARHVHLSQGVANVLFGENYQFRIRRNLSQPGQYACEERIDVVGSQGTLNSVAILGPVRSNTQVEISLTDARKLGVDSHIRESGDLLGTPGCVLRGPNGEIEIKNGVIIAKRHIHMHTKDAEKIGATNGQICRVKIENTGRALIFDDVVIRVSDKFALAMHIDTDEANALNWQEGLNGSVII